MKCPYCDKQPHEIEEYIQYSKLEGVKPDEFVRVNECTYDRKTQLFCCTSCYVKIGMPSQGKLVGVFNLYRREIEPIERS